MTWCRRKGKQNSQQSSTKLWGLSTKISDHLKNALNLHLALFQKVMRFTSLPCLRSSFYLFLFFTFGYFLYIVLHIFPSPSYFTYALTHFHQWVQPGSQEYNRNGPEEAVGRLVAAPFIWCLPVDIQTGAWCTLVFLWCVQPKTDLHGRCYWLGSKCLLNTECDFCMGD